MRRTEEEVLEIASEITISRDDKPEYTFPFGEVQDMMVTNEEGTKLPFKDIYESQKTIVVFIRVSVYISNSLL